MFVGRARARVEVKIDGVALGSQAQRDLLDVAASEQYKGAVGDSFAVGRDIELGRMDSDAPGPEASHLVFEKLQPLLD